MQSKVLNLLETCTNMMSLVNTETGKLYFGEDLD